MAVLIALAACGGNAVHLPTGHAPESAGQRRPSSFIGRYTDYAVPSNFGSNNLQGITVGSDSNLWFAESQGPTSGLMGRITTAGVVTEYQLPKYSDGAALAHPYGVTQGPDGNVWFGATNGVGYITTAGAANLFEIDAASGPTFSSITTGPDGNLWATEQFGGASPNDRIERISTSGSATTVVTLSHLSRPQSIITGPD
ncbi:MAG: hypothetical protein JOZ58_04445, partial [Acetobacteraceae bacterium]|nr:hypothetical protein [Acetobacteraceae bacterium]